MRCKERLQMNWFRRLILLRGLKKKREMALHDLASARGPEHARWAFDKYVELDKQIRG